MNSSSACQVNSSSTDQITTKEPSLKPCCACPDTRKARDECIFLKGEESCLEFIEKHKECLKSYGFLV